MDNAKIIASLILTGHKNAKSRELLAIESGLTDRMVRKAIEESGLPIINVGNGYYIPDPTDLVDRVEANHYYAQEKARAVTQMQKLKRFEEIVSTPLGQMSLEV